MLAERELPDLNARPGSRARSTRSTMPISSTPSGTSHPGAITLHNYPRFLQHFDRPDGS